MQNKPWSLVILAWLQILTPIGNILFNAAVLGVSPLLVAEWLFERPPLEIFEFLLLMPIAGWAILQMRRWSYAVFLLAMAWSFFGKIRHWDYAVSTFSLPVLIFVYLLGAALVLYFLIPAVRRTYFDPTVRWWEAKPRYELKIPAILRLKLGEAEKTIEGFVLNISEGGAFVSVPASMGMDQQLGLEFSVLSVGFNVDGKVVHTRDMGALGTCYGIRFAHTPETARQLRGLARALVELGLDERGDRAHWSQSFRQWLKTLALTGKGWKPEFRYRRPPQA